MHNWLIDSWACRLILEGISKIQISRQDKAGTKNIVAAVS
jgi:hypothetical protein